MPDASDWTRITQVAADAWAVAPAERASYVRAQTQDDALRQAVMALLDAHERSGDFLAEPAWMDDEPPAVLEGRLVGPYAVDALIGFGGMGEVYRAVDTRLDRVVAIKVLPRDLVLEDHARERLRREARAIAALSHPNICHIYDIGLVDGVDHLVLEHLEGETLAARLARGRLPFASAMKVGAEIADALEAVHRARLVHRDPPLLRGFDHRRGLDGAGRLARDD